MNHTLTQTIQATYQKLKQLQREDGTFPGTNLTTGEESQGLFSTIYCSHILSKSRIFCGDVVFMKKIYSCISAHSSHDGAWNYWMEQNQKNESQRKCIRKKCPDDLDDTSLAIHILTTLHPHISNAEHVPDNKHTAHYPRVLKMTDLGYGGPFNTWILDTSTRTQHWHDIDIVVQAHILSSLNALKIDMPGIVSFIDTYIEWGGLQSKYYDNDISILYAITSSYRGKLKDSLRNKIVHQAQLLISHHGSINIVDSARLISCLIMCDGPRSLIDDLYDRLMSHQDTWQMPYPVHIECINAGEKEYIGSTAITLALVIEALELYENIISLKKSAPTDIPPILRTARQNILASPYITSSDLRIRIDSILHDIVSIQNIQKLIMLPASANSSLTSTTSSDPDNISPHIIIGLAGWAAWMHVDIIRDKDNARGDPDPIAIFTILISIVHDAIRTLDISKREHAMIMSIMGTMEQANYEESGDMPITDPRSALSLRERTSAKSIAAGIPLLTFLMYHHAHKNDIEFCVGFFTHFLRARQLSDDAFDWQEDKETGTRTLVTEWIRRELTADASLAEQRQIFSEKIELRVAQEIYRNIEQAYAYARDMSCFTNVSFLTEVMMPYQRGAERVLAKHRYRKMFEEGFWQR